MLRSSLLSLVGWSKKQNPPSLASGGGSVPGLNFGLAQQVTSTRRRVIRLALAAVAGFTISAMGVVKVMCLVELSYPVRGSFSRRGLATGQPRRIRPAGQSAAVGRR